MNGKRHFKYRHWILLILSIQVFSLFAQNPIVPPGVYMADPMARVWQDDILTVYASVDERPEYYCSWRYHVLTTQNLIHWTLHRNRFSSKGDDDQVSYSDALLFAPDCQRFNGRYYLYYCMPDRQYTEGVAVSDYPVGPFQDGQPIQLHGYPEIDPAIFIDDDGSAYYIWGQFTAKMARLNPDRISIDPSSIRDSVLTEASHFFHEGGALSKRDGIYYFIYAHMGRAGRPTCIGYATSQSPMGPYQYGGVIIDNDHCDPEVWNNHGSILEFQGNWYVFYHRSTHGSKTMRKPCIEPITFNPDGSIPEVEMTSQGAGPPLSAFSKVEAERACLLYGRVCIHAWSSDQEMLSRIRHGDQSAFKYIDFGNGVERVTVRVRPGSSPGRIEMVPDSPWKSAAGGIDVPASPQPTKWIELQTELSFLEGTRALWLRFYGDGDHLYDIDWIRFDQRDLSQRR